MNNLPNPNSRKSFLDRQNARRDSGASVDLKFWVVFCMLGFGIYASAQNPPPRQEVRKAIPVAQSSRSPKVEKQASGASVGQQSSEASERASGQNQPELSAARGYDSGGSPSPNTMKALNDKRPIGIRDKLSLTIVEDESPQRLLLTVTDSGEVDVPYIGRVAVDNRTCKELALHIKKLLEKDFYYQATVLVGLDSAGGQMLSKGRYYIHGQVVRTGAHEIPVDEVLTISKAIIRAGGFTQYANEKKVRLLRRNPSRSELDTLEIDMNSIMKKGDTRKDVEILPEDKIFVDEKFFNFL